MFTSDRLADPSTRTLSTLNTMKVLDRPLQALLPFGNVEFFWFVTKYTFIKREQSESVVRNIFIYLFYFIYLIIYLILYFIYLFI